MIKKCCFKLGLWVFLLLPPTLASGENDMITFKVYKADETQGNDKDHKIELKKSDLVKNRQYCFLLMWLNFFTSNDLETIAKQLYQLSGLKTERYKFENHPEVIFYKQKQVKINDKDEEKEGEDVRHKGYEEITTITIYQEPNQNPNKEFFTADNLSNIPGNTIYIRYVELTEDALASLPHITPNGNENGTSNNSYDTSNNNENGTSTNSHVELAEDTSNNNENSDITNSHVKLPKDTSNDNENGIPTNSHNKFIIPSLLVVVILIALYLDNRTPNKPTTTEQSPNRNPPQKKSKTAPKPTTTLKLTKPLILHPPPLPAQKEEHNKSKPRSLSVVILLIILLLLTRALLLYPQKKTY